MFSVTVLVRRNAATAATQQKPEKIEVFVNDKKVLVDPGTTVLQVLESFSLFLWPHYVTQ